VDSHSGGELSQLLESFVVIEGLDWRKPLFVFLSILIVSQEDYTSNKNNFDR